MRRVKWKCSFWLHQSSTICDDDDTRNGNRWCHSERKEAIARRRRLRQFLFPINAKFTSENLECLCRATTISSSSCALLMWRPFSSQQKSDPHPFTTNSFLLIELRALSKVRWSVYRWEHQKHPESLFVRWETNSIFRSRCHVCAWRELFPSPN